MDESEIRQEGNKNKHGIKTPADEKLGTIYKPSAFSKNSRVLMKAISTSTACIHILHAGGLPVANLASPWCCQSKAKLFVR